MGVTDGSGIAATIAKGRGYVTPNSGNGGKYGQLTLKTDGTFKFKASPNIECNRSFNLTLTDGDGDTASTNAPFELTLTKPVFPPDFVLGGQEGEDFSEAHLGKGTQSGQGDLTKELSLPEGYIPNTSGWTTENGAKVLVGKYGKLTWDGDKLTYTLTGNALNSAADDLFTHDSFPTLELKDKNGNTYKVESAIKIADDAPTDVRFEGDSSEHAAGGVYEGSWSADFGADGRATDGAAFQITVSVGGESQTYSMTLGKAQNITLDGKDYGDLTLNSDGTFSFASRPNTEGDLNFVFTVKDADGDTASNNAGFTVSITPPPPPGGGEELFSKDGAAVDESYLPGGTNYVEGQDGSIYLVNEIRLPYIDESNAELCRVDVTGWTRNNQTGLYEYHESGKNGHLAYDAANNKLYYVLDKNAVHGKPGTGSDLAVSETIDNISLIGKLGNTYETKVTVEIADDAPEISMGGGNSDIESGDVYAGTWSVNFGADGRYIGDERAALQLTVSVGGKKGTFDIGIGDDKSATIVIDGKTYGTLTLVDEGNYQFKAAPNLDAELSFVLDAMDAEGDVGKSGGGFTVTVTKPDRSFEDGGTDGCAFDEANLPAGTASAP